MKGILQMPEMFCGSVVSNVEVKDVPEFAREERFYLNSPILIRKKDENNTKHITFHDREFNNLLTENLKRKLKKVNLDSDEIMLELDKSYSSPQTKLVDYKGIKNKTTLAPIIIKGNPEQIAFAWDVGLGESTGIGFGAIK